MSDVRATDIALTLPADAAEQLCFAHMGGVWIADRAQPCAAVLAQLGLVTLAEHGRRGFHLVITDKGRAVAALVMEEVRLRRQLARVDAPLGELLGVPPLNENRAATVSPQMMEGNRHAV